MRRTPSGPQRWAPPGSFDLRKTFEDLHGRPFGTPAPERPAIEVDDELARALNAPVSAGPGVRRRGQTPEGKAKGAIERALKARGWKVQRQQVGRMASGHRFGLTGDPDLLVRLGGGVVAYLEVKRADGKGRVSEAQQRRITRLRSEGYVAEVVLTPGEAIAACERAIAGRRDVR